MDERLKFKLHRMSAWCGFVLMAGFIAAFAAGNLLKPMSPSMSPDEVVKFLTDHQTGILTCVVIMVLTVPFEYPFVVLTSLQLRRIEGGWGLLSMIQLTTGVVAPIGFFFPLAILSAAAFRPESHSPDVLTAMTDMFNLMLVGNACIFVLQVWSIGFGALIDRRPKPVWPRWFGYLNVVLGVLLIPGAFIYLNKTGPLAWNGALANLIPTLTYFVWKIATPIVLLRAVKAEEAETTQAAEAELAST